MPGWVEDGGWSGQHGQNYSGASPKAPGGLVSKLAGRFGGASKTAPLVSTVPLASTRHASSSFVAIASDYEGSGKATQKVATTPAYQFVTSPPPVSEIPANLHLQISAEPEPIEDSPLQIDNLQDHSDDEVEPAAVFPFKQNHVNKLNIAATSAGTATMNQFVRKPQMNPFISPQPSQTTNAPSNTASSAQQHNIWKAPELKSSTPQVHERGPTMPDSRANASSAQSARFSGVHIAAVSQPNTASAALGEKNERGAIPVVPSRGRRRSIETDSTVIPANRNSEAFHPNNVPHLMASYNKTAAPAPVPRTALQPHGSVNVKPKEQESSAAFRAGAISERSQSAAGAGAGTRTAAGAGVENRENGAAEQRNKLNSSTPGRKRPAGSLAPPAQPAMWHIVGTKHPVLIEVPCAAPSLSTHGVYLVWVPPKQQGYEQANAALYLWHSKGASSAERVKGMEIGSSIRELEHATRATVTRLEQGEHDAGLSVALGLPASTAAVPQPQQVAFNAGVWEEKTWQKTMVIKFEGENNVTGGKGFRHVISERPLRRVLLTSPTAAFVVACPGIRLFVWLGKHSSDAAAKAAEAEAMQIGRGAQTQLVVQGWEPTILRALFVDWMTPLGTVARNNENATSSPLAIDGVRLAKASGGTLAKSEDKELVRVFGRKLVMAVQVEAKNVSVTSDQHCYVLATKGVIFQRNATGASPHARAKAAQLTAAFVQTQAGRATVKVLDGGDEMGADAEAFWAALGGRKGGGGGKFGGGVGLGRADGEDDEEAWGRVRLLRVRSDTDSTGQAVDRPYKQGVLGSREAYVLWWEGAHLFVWTGSAASVTLKQQAFNVATALQKQWAQRTRGQPLISIQTAPENAEPPVFQFHFQGWGEDKSIAEEGRTPKNGTPGKFLGVGSATVPAWLKREVSGDGVGGALSPAALCRDWSSGSVGGGAGKDKSTITLEERAGRVDMQKLEGSGALLPPLITPAIKQDDGSLCTVRVWSVKQGRLTEEEARRPLVLSSGKCYAMLYSYCPGVDKRDRRHILYAWHGARAPQQDRASCTMCLNEVSAIVRGQGQEDREVVQEGKESWHFLLACGGLLVRVPPGTGDSASNGTGPTRRGSRMFHVRTVRRDCTVPVVGSAVEVAPTASALFSGDCFVVLPEGWESAARSGRTAAVVWRGAMANEDAARMALVLAGRMLQAGEGKGGWEQQVKWEFEGREGGGFWSSVGGQQAYARMEVPRGPPWKLRQLSEDEDMPGQGSSWKKLGKKGQSGDAAEEEDEGAVLRLFHLEAAGALVHPKEVPVPVPGSKTFAVHIAPETRLLVLDGAIKRGKPQLPAVRKRTCLRHRYAVSGTDMAYGAVRGRAYVWVSGTPRGGMTIEACTAIGASYLAARAQRLEPAQVGQPQPVVPDERLRPKVVMAGSEAAEFKSCFLGWEPL